MRVGVDAGLSLVLYQQLGLAPSFGLANPGGGGPAGGSVSPLLGAYTSLTVMAATGNLQGFMYIL